MTATSTATLPNARFEDDSPLRAMIVTTVDDHDNLDLIEQQIRDFRQWLLNDGQRNKPLINTEYGILMTEDIGFDYGRVRNFMLNSFNRFLNLSDAATGATLPTTIVCCRNGFGSRWQSTTSRDVWCILACMMMKPMPLNRWV